LTVFAFITLEMSWFKFPFCGRRDFQNKN